MDGRIANARLRERLSAPAGSGRFNPDAPDLDEVGREAGRLPSDDRGERRDQLTAGIGSELRV